MGDQAEFDLGEGRSVKIGVQTCPLCSQPIYSNGQIEPCDMTFFNGQMRHVEFAHSKCIDSYYSSNPARGTFAK